MDADSTTSPSDATLFTGEGWFDPIEAGLRGRVRGFIEDLIEEELASALGRGRYVRGGAQAVVATEWRSRALTRYARRTRQVEALIAGAYLAGVNTRRVRRALAALFAGAVSKDIVSRTWRKVKTDWDVWRQRSLAEENIVRLILHGTVVRVRLDKKATNISLLVVLGVRRDGQKVLLSPETAAMLFWALLASGQITMRKVDGWQTLAETVPPPIDLAA
jgi:putative transposase